MQKIHIIDSHTGGEPTRTVIAGGPELGDGDLAARLRRFESEFDHFRSAIVCEPRGSDVLVGALLCQPHQPDCVAGVIFFNNVGYLGMCGHGMIGVVTTLAYLGRIGVGRHSIETPVGVVQATLHEDFSVSIHNVPAYRYRASVALEVPGIGQVVGDIAWGGNWFFLISQHGQTLQTDRVDQLTDYSWRVRQALQKQGISGAGGALIDHIELFGEPADPANHSRNFVLCPGKAYDRSPCGTGTSAKLACLAADGKLAEGQMWHQESIIGSVFQASYQNAADGRILPVLRGTAHVNADAQLLLNPADPFCWGIRN